MKDHSMFAGPTVFTTLPSLIKIKVGMARTLYFCAMSAHLSVSTLTKVTVDGGKHESICSLVDNHHVGTGDVFESTPYKRRERCLLISREHQIWAL